MKRYLPTRCGQIASIRAAEVVIMDPITAAYVMEDAHARADHWSADADDVRAGGGMSALWSEIGDDLAAAIAAVSPRAQAA